MAWWAMKVKRLMHIFKSVVRWAGYIGGMGGAVFIFLMTLLITVDVIGRAFGMPTYVATEMSGYMLIGIVFLGLAYTQRKGRHIKIIILTGKLPPRKRQLLEIATLFVALVFIGWFTWSTFGPAKVNYVLKTTSLTIVNTPLWIPYAFVAVGLGILAIELMIELIREIASLKKQEPDE